MNPYHSLRRIAHTSTREWLALVEASVALSAASLAIRSLPFKSLARAASRAGPKRARAAHDEASVARLVWAVRASAARLPWRNLCFQRGLALHAMLRRRGLPSRLHYGVGRLPDRPLSAHVWVSLDDTVIEGQDGIAGHACLATFPAVQQERRAKP